MSDDLVYLLGWTGMYAPMAMGAIGSIMGCAIPGQTACGAMLDVDSGYGRFVGLSAMPSSQTIYGIVVMFTLQNAATDPDNGTLVLTRENAYGIFAIGVLVGLALLLSALYQGYCLAAAINASKSKPEIFGLSVAPAAIIEGFAVFAFVFALVLSGAMPEARAAEASENAHTTRHQPRPASWQVSQDCTRTGTHTMSANQTTSGVQHLIDRLSQEGVAEGERQANELVEAAEKKANQIVDAARREADEIVAQARKEAEKFTTAGKDALQLACRDAVRDLGSRIHEGFRDRLQELVRQELRNGGLLKQMILEITGKAKPEEGNVEIEVLLPRHAVSEEDLRQRIQAGEQDAITEFVHGLMGLEIREGYAIRLHDNEQSGLRVRVVDEHVEVDLSDDAITELLADHMLPRYRALMKHVRSA